jgi:sulfatase maturation enzyme AslB (radical SAM superfamily)
MKKMASAPAEQVNLEAQSPFEMRVHLGEQVPEMDVRAALKTGDLGFLHSFTTGSAVDGPGIRLVAWTTACMFRCQYCHNPDTWTLSNGIPVPLEKAIEEIRKYAPGLKAMHGGFTLSGGEPLMQDRFAARLFAATKGMGVHTAIETNGGQCGCATYWFQGSPTLPRKWRRWRNSAHRSVSLNASRSCRSTRWESTNGSGLGWTTS